MSNDLFKQLNEPFEYLEYKVNYEGYVAVGPQSIADRLNQVLGIYNWKHDIREFKEDRKNFTVSILGQLDVKDPSNDQWISRTQFGDKKVQKSSEAEEPTAQAFLDAQKAAVSDSLKKCASLFGVASDVYKGRVKGIKAKNENNQPNKMYLALADYFGLDILYDNHFKLGITVLPDDYKPYYQKNEWLGIYEGDLKSVMAAWRQKQGQGGSATTDRGTGMSHSTAADHPQQTRHPSATGRTPRQASNSQPKIDNEMYEFVDLIAGSKGDIPYFEMSFKHKGQQIKVYAHDSKVLAFIERINLKPGSKCKLQLQKSEKGSFVVKRINKIAS